MSSAPADPAALQGLLASSANSPSCSAEPPVSCLAPESPVPCSLSPETAEALFVAVDAKAALDAAKQRYEQALANLDELVEVGALPDKHLPLVAGHTLYRQEGRVSWLYPESIKQLEAQVKKRKQLAEQLGEATQKRGKPFWTIKEASPLQLDSPLLRNQEQL
jgi:hypothetical protein